MAKCCNVKASFNHVSHSLETSMLKSTVRQYVGWARIPLSKGACFEFTFLCNECKCYQITSNSCKWCVFYPFAGQILQVLTFLNFQLSFLSYQAMPSSWLSCTSVCSQLNAALNITRKAASFKVFLGLLFSCKRHANPPEKEINAIKC